MTGPFYVRDKDFIDHEVYVLADCCKECAFCDESDGGWCPMNPCIYFKEFDFVESEENEDGYDK